MALAALIISIVAALGVVAQVYWAAKLLKSEDFWAAKQLRADHERRCKQSTLDAWGSMRSETAGQRRLIQKTYLGNPTLNEAVAHALFDGSPDQTALQEAILYHLNAMERIAVGAHLGIYDLDVLDTVGRGAVIGAVKRFGSLITIGRAQLGEPRLFSELEWLAAELDRRSKPTTPPPGRIKES